jgi:hypothetical protein
LLVDSTVFVVDLNVSVLNILLSSDHHDLSSLIDKVAILVSELLPPSGVSASHFEVVVSTISFNVQRSVLVSLRFDSLCGSIEVVLLFFSVLYTSLKSEMESTDKFITSLEEHS